MSVAGSARWLLSPPLLMNIEQAPGEPISKTAGSGSQTQERQGKLLVSRSATGGLGEQATLVSDGFLLSFYSLFYTLPCLSCLQATVDLISS